MSVLSFRIFCALRKIGKRLPRLYDIPLPRESLVFSRSSIVDLRIGRSTDPGSISSRFIFPHALGRSDARRGEAMRRSRGMRRDGRHGTWRFRLLENFNFISYPCERTKTGIGRTRGGRRFRWRVNCTRLSRRDENGFSGTTPSKDDYTLAKGPWQSDAFSRTSAPRLCIDPAQPPRQLLRDDTNPSNFAPTLSPNDPTGRVLKLRVDA